MTHSTNGVSQVTVNILHVLALALVVAAVSVVICTMSDRRRKVRNRRVRIVRRARLGSN